MTNISTFDKILIQLLDVNTRGLKYIKLLELIYNKTGTEITKYISINRLRDVDNGNYMYSDVHSYLLNEIKCKMLKSYIIMEYCKYYAKLCDYTDFQLYTSDLATDA